MIGTQLAFGALALIGGIGAWHDYRERRIPNWICLLAAIGGIVWAASFGGWPSIGWHLLHFIAALLVGMAIYALKYWGGGDAKFYAGLASWFSISQSLALLLLVSAFGLVLVASAFALRRRRVGQGTARPLPYGIAISSGAIVGFVLLYAPF